MTRASSGQQRRDFVIGMDVVREAMQENDRPTRRRAHFHIADVQNARVDVFNQ